MQSTGTMKAFDDAAPMPRHQTPMPTMSTMSQKPNLESGARDHEYANQTRPFDGEFS